MFYIWSSHIPVYILYFTSYKKDLLFQLIIRCVQSFQSSWITNKQMGQSHPSLYYNHIKRKQSHILLRVEWKPGTLVLSDCHNTAGTLCITQPIKMFSHNFVNCSLIPHYFYWCIWELFNKKSNMKHHYKLSYFTLCGQVPFFSYWLKSIK